MPFKSKKQQRFMFAAEGRGEIPKGTARRWAHHTKDIKSLPETAHKKKGEDMTSAAYQFGMATGMNKQAGPMAWLGRKAVMPAVKGMAKPLEWLLGKLPGKTMAGATKSVGGYRAGLDKAMREPSAQLFKGKGKAKELEALISRQKAYGGAGAAAVGIPALASVLAAVSQGRRRKAEEALKAELAASEATKEAAVPAFLRNAGKWVKKHPKTAIGGGAGAAITAGVVGGVAGGKRHQKKKEEEKKEAQLGTPFMDGFLIQCAQAGLNEKQTADVLEKASQDAGVVGKECKAFLERLAACDE